MVSNWALCHVSPYLNLLSLQVYRPFKFILCIVVRGTSELRSLEVESMSSLLSLRDTGERVEGSPY